MGAANRGEEQFDAQCRGHLCGLPGDIGAAVVREPFEPVWNLEGPEAALDSGDHQVAHHLAGDAGIGDGRPGNDLPIAGVDDEDDAHHLAIAGMDFEMIGTPADIGAQSNHNTIVGPGGPQGRMLLKGEPVLLHDPEDTLGVEGGLALLAPLSIEQCRDTPIAIGGTLVDDRTHLGKQGNILGLAIRAARL